MEAPRIWQRLFRAGWDDFQPAPGEHFEPRPTDTATLSAHRRCLGYGEMRNRLTPSRWQTVGSDAPAWEAFEVVGRRDRRWYFTVPLAAGVKNSRLVPTGEPGKAAFARFEGTGSADAALVAAVARHPGFRSELAVDGNLMVVTAAVAPADFPAWLADQGTLALAIAAELDARHVDEGPEPTSVDQGQVEPGRWEQPPRP